MMEQYWYEEQKQQHFSGADKKGKRGRSVSLATLVVCMLITGLIGGAAGGLISHNAQQQQLLEVQQQLQQQINALPAANVPLQNTENAPAATPGGSDVVPAVQPASGETYSKAQIIEYASPSIVGIDVEVPGYGWYGQQMQTGSGSGIILSADGYIITNNHVIAGAQNIKVYLSDDTEYAAELVATDARTDLAVIKIEATGLTAVALGDSEQLRVGEDVIAIGNPLGELRGTATSGMISALARTLIIEDEEMTLLQTDAAINPGNSGGGLFNMRGELVGVVNAKVASSSVEGLGFAIPINDAKAVVADLMDLGYVSGRAYLGIHMDNVVLQPEGSTGQHDYGFDSFFSIFGGQQQAYETRVEVKRLVPGGAAEKAGIQVGDYILAVDDKEIADINTLSAVIRDYSAGDSATIKVQRGEKILSIRVVFGENVPDAQ